MSLYKLPGSLVMVVLVCTGCATSMNTGSEIPGQLDDGGWVMNIPGVPHTHRVVLAECPDQPVIITHTHDHNQVGQGLHKHNGCFTCPVKPSLKSRLLNG